MQIEISIAEQRLLLRDDAGTVIAHYPVSTAIKGAGEQKNSYRTPRGRHVVRAKIGAGAPIGSVFKGRRATGETWTPALGEQYPGRDFILTRILWLSGCELGRNRLGNVEPMGAPHSPGCVRMRNADVVALFDAVPVGTPVVITDA